MSSSHDRAQRYLERLLLTGDAAAIRERLSSKYHPAPPRLPGASVATPEAVAKRWGILPSAESSKPALSADGTDPRGYAANIENFIGFAKLPIGVAGPLRVNGLSAQGDYYVPLATTEAALVASYDRGARVITEAGGCASTLVAEGLSRAPGFAFRSLNEAGEFVAWALSQLDQFRVCAEETTGHGRLVDTRITVEGNHVYLLFEFLTGDAAGQNMVTIATQAICDCINANSPVRPEYFFVESNLSGDKKASVQSFQSVRGRKVSAEVTLSAELIARRLHTTSEQMVNYWRMSALGGVLSGTIGVQGQYANGLAALYLATGQDVACVAESAVGVTRFEAKPDGALYAAVTLPNLVVGTVGGGTALPTQAACLDILGLRGTGNARALAEVTAALVLAGELSIIGALSAHHFTRAHQRLARGKRGASPIGD